MQILLRANLLSQLEDPRLDLCRSRFFPAPGELLSQLLAHCRATGQEISFLRDMRWTAREMAQADAYLVARAQTIAQPRHLHEVQQAESQRIPTASKWGSIVSYRMVHLNRCPPPGSFRLLDQWTNELLASPDLELASLRGVALEPVGGAVHVRVGHILGPAAWDQTLCETWDNGPGAPSTPRHRGTLTFPAASLAGDWDLARTAEPFGCNGTGLLVVSSHFYRCYHQNGWKGLRFWPVWSENAHFPQQQLALWQETMSQLQSYPKAQLWC
jgi:hypothetical protein